MKKIRIIADTYLFSLTLTGFITMVGSLVCVLVLHYFRDNGIPMETKNMVLSLMLFLTMTPCAISLTYDTRWSNTLVLSKGQIELHAICRKPKIYDYREFPYIYRATYRHYLVGAPDVGKVHVYMVLSRRRLTDFEKTHINQVSAPNDVIRIKFSKKRYQILREAMPPKLSREVERTFAQDIRQLREDK